MTEPRYETAYEQQQRIGRTDSVVCADCGAFVMNVAAHDRFHLTLSGHGEGANTVIRHGHGPDDRCPPSCAGDAG